MKKYFKYIFAFISLFCFSNVYATPANDSFLDDNLYKCIIDAYNLSNDESKDYSYNILPEELIEISSLDCSSYKGKIEDLTGLNKMTGLTSLNLSGNTFLGGSLTLTTNTGSLKSNIVLPSSLSITDKKYTYDTNGIVTIDTNGVVTAVKNGSTYVTMTGKITGNEIKERYLVSVNDGTTVTKSSNTKLSSLYLSSGEFKFDNNVRNYSTIVDNSVTSVKVTATLLDKKAKFVSGYGPRTVTLKTGTNNIEIRVQAEDGTIGTYLIGVIRSDGNDADNRLINIELSVGTINFSPEVYTYNFSVASNVDEIDVKGVSESTLSTVKVTDIDGNTKENKISSKLKVGSNKILIKVTSESGSSQEYQLIITREDYDSLENYLSNINIEGYSIEFKRDVYEYELDINNEDYLYITPTKETESATYNIKGNSNLVNGSKIIISVSDTEGSTREYIITVHKEEKMEFPIKWIVLGIEFITIIVLLIIVILNSKNVPRKPKKMKNKVKRPVQPRNNINNNYNMCRNCGAFNDTKSKTCYVCGNRLK